MDRSVDKHQYYHGYPRNELAWITFFTSIIKGVQAGDVNYFAAGEYTQGHLNGFITAKSFQTYYTNDIIMDVKDCIVDPDRDSNIFTVIKLFDAMLDHVKKHGGRHWRADSVHNEQDAMRYAQFLKKKYGAAIHTSARGVIDVRN